MEGNRHRSCATGVMGYWPLLFYSSYLSWGLFIFYILICLTFCLVWHNSRSFPIFSPWQFHSLFWFQIYISGPTLTPKLLNHLSNISTELYLDVTSKHLKVNPSSLSELNLLISLFFCGHCHLRHCVSKPH